MNKDTVKAFIGKFRVASGLQQLSDKLLEKVDNETITSDEIEQISRYVGLTKTTTAKYGKHTSNAGTGYEEDKVTIKSDIDAPYPVITYNSVTYELNKAGTEYSITGVTDKTLTTYELKDYIKSVPVTSIGNFAFDGCSSLSSITIPSSVTSIGDGAFQGCSSLSSITIPASVTSIGNTVFAECRSLSSITIPNSVTSIGAFVFSGCWALSSITIPNSVTSIGAYAFEDCSKLSSITIPNSVTSIGDGAFQGCSSLSSITIPASVTSIGNTVFADCSSLSSVKVSWTTAETIPSITGKLVFNNTLLAKVLHVPAGTSALYATWKTDGNFASIVEDAV